MIKLCSVLGHQTTSKDGVVQMVGATYDPDRTPASRIYVWCWCCHKVILTTDYEFVQEGDFTVLRSIPPGGNKNRREGKVEKAEQIKGFQGQYRFLSNFYPCTVEFEGYTYLSSEAAYQANKFTDSPTFPIDFPNLNAREARRQGQIMPARKDWDKDKLNVMYRILRAKFSQNKDLRERLIDTKHAYLEETNYWHDTFWGVYNGQGMNHLGRLLMVVRDEINEGII